MNDRKFRNKRIRIGDTVLVHGEPPEGSVHTHLPPNDEVIGRTGTVVELDFFEFDTSMFDEENVKRFDYDVMVKFSDDESFYIDIDTQYLSIVEKGQ